MSRIVFDEPAWWQRPGWQLASAALLTLLAGIVWWSALTPVDHEPIVVRAPVTPVARAAPPPAAAPAPQPLRSTPPAPPVEATPAPTTPPLSTMVAPGVHVTPLGVPHGTVPMPAGPNETDSEPEN
jgi:hypothetical protein